jgi:hypothetical protein
MGKNQNAVLLYWPCWLPRIVRETGEARGKEMLSTNIHTASRNVYGLCLGHRGTNVKDRLRADCRVHTALHAAYCKTILSQASSHHREGSAHR